MRGRTEKGREDRSGGAEEARGELESELTVETGESRRTQERLVEGPQRGTRPTEPTKTYVIDQKFSQQCCYCEDGDGCNKISYILEQDGPL